MIKRGPKYVKLKTDLRLACQRLKMLQAKKSELSEKLQKEVANHLNKGKYMLAKIKVQTVIRYEEGQEAMEIIEMLCEQLLDRYGLFEEKKKLDESLEEAVSSLIWVSPYMRTEVIELRDIVKQFSAKYGSKFAKSALKNKHFKVNTQLIERVKLNISSEDKIHEYLRNIAKKHSISEDRKIELEIYLLKASALENKTIAQNVDAEESARSSSATSKAVTTKGGQDSETFEGYGTSKSGAYVSCKKTFSNLKFHKNRRPRVPWVRKFLNGSTLPDIPEENEDIEAENVLHGHYYHIIENRSDDSVNKGDTISNSVSRRHRMVETVDDYDRQNSYTVNQEVPTEIEIRSNFLLSSFKKKGKSRMKIPTRYETDAGSSSDEEETKNFSKKPEGDSSISSGSFINDRKENDVINDDFDQPPAYETVISNTNDDDLDIAQPYHFDVDIKLECFPQYPTLPTCPSFEDISEDFENTAPSYNREDLDKADKSVLYKQRSQKK